MDFRADWEIRPFESDNTTLPLKHIPISPTPRPSCSMLSFRHSPRNQAAIGLEPFDVSTLNSRRIQNIVEMRFRHRLARCQDEQFIHLTSPPSCESNNKTMEVNSIDQVLPGLWSDDPIRDKAVFSLKLSHNRLRPTILGKSTPPDAYASRRYVICRSMNTWDCSFFLTCKR